MVPVNPGFLILATVPWSVVDGNCAFTVNPVSDPAQDLHLVVGRTSCRSLAQAADHPSTEAPIIQSYLEGH